jgi:5-methylcytosine-specific restriction endonuclease McrA
MSQTSEQKKSWIQLNRAKINEYMRNWRKSESGKRCELARHLSRTYDMTIEDKQKMWDDQNGLCAVCGDPLPDIYDRDCQVEHAHEPFKIRGLTHWQCNILVGTMESRPILLDKIVAYLAR